MINPVVARNYINNPNIDFLLHHAYYESNAIGNILVKKTLSQNDYYLLILHILRKYEAKYAKKTDDKSIIETEVAKNIRNIVAHLFYVLDQKILFEFARADQASTHLHLLKKIDPAHGSNITQNIQDTKLYKFFLPKLATADEVFTVNGLIKHIIDGINGLFQITAQLDKTQLFLSPDLTDIIKMRLTCIGQYIRLLNISDNNFEVLSKTLTMIFKENTEDSFIQSIVLFFKNCHAIRNKVAHEFFSLDETISLSWISKMMMWNKNICRNLKPDWAFILQPHITNQPISTLPCC